MKGQSLKQLIESKGHERVGQILVEELHKEKDGLVPEDFSIRELYEAFIGLKHLGYARNRTGFVEMPSLTEAAVGTSVFPQITGELISKKVIEGYNTIGYIGDKLVTVMPSKLKSEKIAGFSAVEKPKEVKEGMPYDESGLTEKYVTTTTSKKGLIISLTEEMIYMDQTGQLLMRAQQIGEKCRYEREEVILTGVQDLNSTVYRPSGSATALYATGYKNLKASNALVDWTDIDACLQQMATVVDENGDKILVIPKTLLVPPALLFTAKRIVSATEIVVVTPGYATSGNPTNTRVNNPVSNYEILSSPLMSSSSSWWLGDFKKQYIWQEIWPIQTFQQRADSEKGFERDVVARYKVRYYGGIAAIDTPYVCKNTA